MKFEFKWFQRRCFKNVDGRRTPESSFRIQLAQPLVFGSGELKIFSNFVAAFKDQIQINVSCESPAGRRVI